MYCIAFLGLIWGSTASIYSRRYLYDSEDCSGNYTALDIFETYDPPHCITIGSASVEYGCTAAGAAKVFRYHYSTPNCDSPSVPEGVTAGACIKSLLPGRWEELSCLGELPQAPINDNSFSEVTVSKFDDSPTCTSNVTASKNTVATGVCSVGFLPDYSAAGSDKYYCSDHYLTIYSYSSATCSGSASSMHQVPQGCLKLDTKGGYLISCHAADDAVSYVIMYVAVGGVLVLFLLVGVGAMMYVRQQQRR